MKAWNEDTRFQRRQEFSHEFRSFNLKDYECFITARRTQKAVVEWHLKAIKMAMSGRYYMRELSPILNKTPEAVSMMFTRLRALKNVRGSGWPVPVKIPDGAKLINANGVWRIEHAYPVPTQDD